MKLKSFLIGSTLIAALVIGGCNENDTPTDPTPTGVAPKAVTNLVAVSLSETSVGLRWNSPVDTSLAGYDVSWKSSDGTDSGSVSVAPATDMFRGPPRLGSKVKPLPFDEAFSYRRMVVAALAASLLNRCAPAQVTLTPVESSVPRLVFTVKL